MFKLVDIAANTISTENLKKKIYLSKSSAKSSQK